MKFNIKTLCAFGALLYFSDVMATAIIKSENDDNFKLIREIHGVQVELRPLVNSKCRKTNPDTGEKELVFREREKDEQQIKGIILHYSVCPDADVLEDAFYSRGKSSHYDVDFDGELFEFVYPNYVAFHAGKSAWNGISDLNKSFIGVQQDMWGYYEEANKKRYNYDRFGRPVQLPGDDRRWFEYSKKQVKSAGQLIFALQQEYNISGRFVVTHSDVAIGRKSDAGPMFPYKEIFEKYGAGYYPKTKYINLNKFSELRDEDYVKLLEIYGYGRDEKGRAFDCSDKQIIKAFKLHFYPGDLSKDLNDDTKKMILNLVASYYNYKDKITGSFDKPFIADIDFFLSENKSRTQSLSDFITGWNNYSNVRAMLSQIGDFLCDRILKKFGKYFNFSKVS